MSIRLPDRIMTSGRAGAEQEAPQHRFSDCDRARGMAFRVLIIRIHGGIARAPCRRTAPEIEQALSDHHAHTSVTSTAFQTLVTPTSRTAVARVDSAVPTITFVSDGDDHAIVELRRLGGIGRQLAAQLIEPGGVDPFQLGYRDAVDGLHRRRLDGLYGGRRQVLGLLAGRPTEADRDVGTLQQLRCAADHDAHLAAARLPRWSPAL